MADRGVIEILQDVPVYIYIANLSVKAASIPEHMIVASATTSLLYSMHSRSDEPETLKKPILDNTTHTNGERVGTNIIIPSTAKEIPHLRRTKPPKMF